MSAFNTSCPWRVEWIEYPSGIHHDKQFRNRESAELFFSQFLTDRYLLEKLHSVALQWIDFIQPGACFVYSLKEYRNKPENERRIKE